MALVGKTILVVDDSVDDRWFIARALKRLSTGLSVQFVRSGEEAVAYLDGAGAYGDRLLYPYPAFVITDLNMARGDGFYVLTHLKAHAGTQTPVMMLTGSDEPANKRRALELGAKCFGVKPHSPNDFVPLISTFLVAAETGDAAESAGGCEGCCSNTTAMNN